MSKITKITTLAKGKFLEMDLIDFRDRKGVDRKWEAVKRTNSNGAALIIARIVPDDKFVLIRQFRPPAGKVVLEFPAGLIDEGEKGCEAAVRELYEETGYTGRVVETAADSFSSPGMSGEFLSLVFMEIDGKQYENAPPVAHPEENEFIEVFTVARKDLSAFLEEQRAAGIGIDAKLQTFVSALRYT